MFDALIQFWKAVKVTYISGDINKPMYYYLTGVIFVVAGLVVYILWAGFVGLTAIVNQWILGRPTDIPFTIISAVGIVYIIRYSLFGAIETLKKKAPENLEQRLRAVEEKMDILYRMATDDDFEPPSSPPKLPTKSKE